MAGQFPSWWPFRRHRSRLETAGESDEERAKRQTRDALLEAEYLERVRRIEDEYIVHRRGEDDEHTDEQRKQEDAYNVGRRKAKGEPSP